MQEAHGLDWPHLLFRRGDLPTPEFLQRLSAWRSLSDLDLSRWVSLILQRYKGVVAFLFQFQKEICHFTLFLGGVHSQETSVDQMFLIAQVGRIFPSLWNICEPLQPGRAAEIVGIKWLCWHWGKAFLWLFCKKQICLRLCHMLLRFWNLEGCCSVL